MASLKEEYETKKRVQDKKNLVESYNVLKEYFILYEEIDAAELTKMGQAIEQLESVFAKIPGMKQKMPILSQVMGIAIKDIENFASGAVNNQGGAANMISLFAKKKFDNPLTKASGLFTVLTSFLRKDLPAILKVYRGNVKDPKAATDLPFEATIDNPTKKNNIVNIIIKALTPAGFLGALGIKQVPYIGRSLPQVAEEFLQLTQKDLMYLTQQTQQIQTPISAQDLQAASKQIAAGQNPIGPPATNNQQNGQQPNQPPSTAVSVHPLTDNQILQHVTPKNLEAVKKILKALGIPLVAASTPAPAAT